MYFLFWKMGIFRYLTCFFALNFISSVVLASAGSYDVDNDPYAILTSLDEISEGEATTLFCNGFDKFGIRVIDRAALFGWSEVAKKIMDLCPDIDLTGKNKFGFSTLDYAEQQIKNLDNRNVRSILNGKALAQAIGAGTLTQASDLLKNPLIDFAHLEAGSLSIPILACRNHIFLSDEFIQNLFSKVSSSILAMKSDQGLSVLSYAAFSNYGFGVNFDLIELILHVCGQTFPMEIINEPLMEENGAMHEPILMLATKNSRYDLVKLLLSLPGIEKDCRDNQDLTPGHWASIFDVKMALLFSPPGFHQNDASMYPSPTITNQIDDEIHLPSSDGDLFLAILNDNDELMAQILSQSPTTSNAAHSNENGSSPIRLAISSASLRCVRALIRDEQVFQEDLGQDWNLIHLAIHHQSFEMLDILLSTEAGIRLLLEGRKSDGMTPWEMAISIARNTDQNVCEMDQILGLVLQKILENKLSTLPELKEIAMKYGIDIWRNCENQSLSIIRFPLHFAAQLGKYEYIERYLDQVNRQDNLGNTAFHVAIRKLLKYNDVKYEKCCRILAKFSDAGIPDNLGQTVADLAKEHNIDLENFINEPLDENDEPNDEPNNEPNNEPNDEPIETPGNDEDTAYSSCGSESKESLSLSSDDEFEVICGGTVRPDSNGNHPKSCSICGQRYHNKRTCYLGVNGERFHIRKSSKGLFEF